MKLPKTFWLGVSSCLLLTPGLTTQPVLASEEVAVRYGLLEESLPVADLRNYAEKQQVSAGMRDLLRFMSPTDQVELREFLQAKLPLDLVTVDRVLNRAPGTKFLVQAATATARGDHAGVQALRAAIVLGIQPNQGLSVLSFLEAYPNKRLTIDLPQALKVLAAASPKPPTDILSQLLFWRTMVDYQTTVSRGKQYQTCLFGDSISAQLGNSLGEKTFNFSLGGMSTVSLLEQIQHLATAGIKCQTAVVAIGTNDAWYTIDDDQFSQNLSQVIDRLRSLGSPKIVLLPAFYSTLAASEDSELAGSLDRVEQINRLLGQVAVARQVPVQTVALQPLFDGKTLKSNLTSDGVHLNAEGLQIYREALLKIMSGQLSEDQVK
jgi:hypothetical protein